MVKLDISRRLNYKNGKFCDVSRGWYFVEKAKPFGRVSTQFFRKSLISLTFPDPLTNSLTSWLPLPSGNPVWASINPPTYDICGKISDFSLIETQPFYLLQIGIKFETFDLPKVSELYVENGYLCWQARKCHIWFVTAYFTDQSVMQRGNPWDRILWRSANAEMKYTNR